MHNSKEHQRCWQLENPAKWNKCVKILVTQEIAPGKICHNVLFGHSKISFQKLTTEHCRKKHEKQIKYPKLEIWQLRHVWRKSNARMYIPHFFVLDWVTLQPTCRWGSWDYNLVTNYFQNSCDSRDKDGCTPNSVPMVFIVFSRDSWDWGIITHKYPLL